jgi:hypothetical protein
MKDTVSKHADRADTDSAQMARSSSVNPWFHDDADERVTRLLLAWLLTAANVIDWAEGLLRRGVSKDGEDGVRCEDGRLEERPARSPFQPVASRSRRKG